MAEENKEPFNAAAQYSETGNRDEQAVAILKLLLSQSKRSSGADLKEADKTPNFDGYIIIHKEIGGKQSGQPLGTLRVQVKSLPKNGGGKPRYQFKNEKFFGAVKAHGDEIPIILIAVDIENQIAYWRHITSAFLDGLGTSKTVTLDADPPITASDSTYIEAWEKIISDHKSVVRDGNQARISFSLLSEIAEPFPDLSEDYITSISDFLKVLNSELDGPLKDIKPRLFANADRIGFAYGEFSNEYMTYALFEIPRGRLDPPIKKLKTQNWDEVLPHTKQFTVHHGNPIIEGPERFAIELLEKRLEELTKKNLFYHDHSIEFASDFLVSAVRHLHFALGLKEENHYSTREVEYAVREYLPVWAHEAANLLISKRINRISSFADALKKDFVGNPLYFDPEDLYRQITDYGTREDLAGRVEALLQNKQGKKIGPIGHSLYPLRILLESVNSLKDRGVEDVTSHLPPRSKFTSSHWKWSKDEWIKFGESFLPLAYHDFRAMVNRNFPKQEEDILKLTGFSKPRICSIEFTERGNLGAGLDVAYASLSRSDGLTGEVFCHIEQPEDMRKRAHEYMDLPSITLDGTIYDISAGGWYHIGVSDLYGAPLFIHHYNSFSGKWRQWARLRAKEYQT